ncbi:MAG: c-type cytochrome, partial [Gammaproteobacteria bacterium]|nr:c-type cytochrome [Gammaproteobacteria bacterium]
GFYFGTSAEADPAATSSGWVTAVDAATGKVRWQFHAPEPVIAGVTPTAGGLVFTGDGGGDFYAFDAADGKMLLQYASGGSMAGGVITYAVRGKQYVAFTSGNISRLGTFNTTGSPTLVVMALNVPAGSPEIVTLADAGVAQMQVAAGIGTTMVTHGQQIFAANCAVCHGAYGEGGVGPSLQDESTRKDLDEVIAWIKDPKPPMPKLYPKPLNEADVQAVAAYVETLKKP